MTITEAKRQTRLIVWQQRIQEQRESGISIKAWCAQQECSEGQFYYWLKVTRENTLKQLEEPLSLVQVKPSELPVTAAQTYEEVNQITVCCGKVSIVFPAQTDVKTLAALAVELNSHD